MISTDSRYTAKSSSTTEYQISTLTLPVNAKGTQRISTRSPGAMNSSKCLGSTARKAAKDSSLTPSTSESIKPERTAAAHDSSNCSVLRT